MSRSSRKSPFKKFNARLYVEALENRVTPTATITNAISGYVYYDANNNGLFDPGETPIANNTVQLQNAQGAIIGTTTTDANGFYQFNTDQTNLTQDGSVTKTVTFPSTDTNFNLSGVLDQFDPSLGQLVSVEIQHSGSITSEIKVENLSSDSGSTITGNVSGTLNLVAPGVNDNLAISGYAGSFDAAQFDGNNDFSGDSGTSFGQKSADGSNTIMVTDPTALAAYTGTGTVNINETGTATSNATGGGNLEVNVKSTGEATITVIYHYKSAGPLQPGDYKVVQPNEPDGYTDGQESQGGVVIPNTIGTDFINVTIPDGGGTSTDNDFGELKATSISGHVYYDANNNGVMDSGESGIANVTMTLTGGAGGPVTTTTDANGFYHFDNLTPGTYAVAETQPTDYLNGTDAAGTNGGTVNNVPGAENISDITLNSGDNAQNYDFGELKAASLAGTVYVDAHNDGQLDAGDPPIANDTITLTGFDDQGPVSKTTTTAADGSYAFSNLRPGTYAITQTQPAGYNEGATTVGSQGGDAATDVISNINLAAGVNGVNNNFGDLKPDQPGNPQPKDVNLLGLLPWLSKSQLTAHPTMANFNPAVRGQMAFVVGANITLTGQQPPLATTLTGVLNLQAGKATTASYINELWASEAHRALQVRQAYQDVLGRAPTATETAQGVTQLNSGTTQLALTENLFVSPEYQALHGTQESLAQALYKDILNTTPGTAATQSLLQSMDSEPLNTVVNDLLMSDASLSNLIDNAYRATLRRPATAAEIQTWSAPIKAGTMTLDSLAQRLLASQEFYSLTYNTIR
jgi:protocatechuate 3,4-dioxygenase beta subunit